MSNDSKMMTSDLMDAVRELYRAVGRFDEGVASNLKIDRTSLRAIDALKNGPLHPKDFAEKLGVTTASVTAMLDRLEKAGHISRTPSPTDRRSSIVNLTDMSRRKAKENYGPLGDTIRAAFSVHTSEDLQNAKNIIEALRKAFDDSN